MSDTSTVLSTFQFSSAALQFIRETAQTDVICISNNDELQARLPEAEVLCSYWLPQQWRTLTPRLRWLQVAGAGVDGLQTSGILDPDSGITVTTAVGINAAVIGEYVFGSMLMFNRKWPEMVLLQQRHIWPRSGNWYKLGGRELADQTLGIIGLGNIGRRIAQLGRAFGMHVIGTRRGAGADTTDPDVDQLYPLAQLHNMLRQSDYVVIAVPLTRDTRHMIGEAELRAMRPHAYLVNIARGPVIDERALIHALTEKWIAGAGLDVTEEEPLPPESALFSLPNVILTPHISGVSTQYDKRLSALFADNLRRYRAGEPLRNRYDAARGY